MNLLRSIFYTGRHFATTTPGKPVLVTETRGAGQARRVRPRYGVAAIALPGAAGGDVGMTIKAHTCHTIVCDDCGEDLQPGDEYIAHFPAADDARSSACDDYGWTQDGDRDLCGHCTAVAVCAREGHQPEVYDANSNREWCKRCRGHLRDVVSPPVKAGFL